MFIQLFEWLLGQLWDRLETGFAALFGPLSSQIASIISESMQQSSTSRVRGESSISENLVLATLILETILTSDVVFRIMALDSVLLAIEGIYNYVTMGIGTIAKKIANKVLSISMKELIKGLIKIGAYGGIIAGLAGAFLTGDMSEILGAFKDVVGLPHEILDFMNKFASTAFVMFFSRLGTGGKSPLLFYAALTAATFGLTFSALSELLPPMNKESKIRIDAILLVVSSFGFIVWNVAKSSKTMFWRKIVDGFTTLIELFISLGAIAVLTIQLLKDINSTS